MKKMLLFSFLCFVSVSISGQNYSEERRNVRIGKVGDTGNLNVPKGSITTQLNLDFTGFRDVAADQIGARISALRFNFTGPGSPAYLQNTGLAFYTNPSGINTGSVDLQERMRITPKGNIGIGMIDPQYNLDVNGSIRAKDAYFMEGIRIGKIDDAGDLNVPEGSITAQLNLDFTGFRDVAADQIGARISALRFNFTGPGSPAYLQNTGLVFYTNPSGINTGSVDLQERMRISPKGNIGIGTKNPTYLLDVAGTIRAEEVKVEIIKGADHVFHESYGLRSLDEVESFIKENKHLPEIPSEKNMQEEGISLNEFQIKLLQKIEELTLYVIDQNKRIENQEERLSNQYKQIEDLESELVSIKRAK